MKLREVDGFQTDVMGGQRARRERPPAAIWAPAALVGMGMIIPLAYLILRTLGAGSEVWDLLFRSRTLDILVRSILLAVTVTGASVAIAVPLAWLTIRTDLPFRGVWSVVTALPLVIPSYVAGFLVVIVLGPKGMLQGWLAPLGVERLPEIFGFPGAAFTLTLLSYPYVLLPVRAALGNIDPSLEETSSLLGKSAWTTFFRVTLPLLRPAIAAGALLVALYTLSDFGAVSLLRYETFTWAIYVQYGYLARDLAAALSLVLVALALTILVLEASARGRAGYHRSATGAVRPAPTVRLGRWRWPALALCSTIVLLSLVMPMSVLGYWVVRGVSAGEELLSLWGQARELAVRFRDCCPRYHTGGRAYSNTDGPLPGPAQQYSGAIHLPWFCSAGRCGCPCAGLLRNQICNAVVPDPGTPHFRLHGAVPSNSGRSRQVFAAPGGSRAGGRRQKPWAHAFPCPAFDHRATGASRYTRGGGSGFPLDHERAPGYPYT